MSDEPTTTLVTLQRELALWQAHNFPGRPAWQPLVGLQEELGELSHAFLKREQGIRGTAEEHNAKMRDAVADIAIFLADFCNAEGIDLDAAIRETWAQVRQRDWRPKPAEGLSGPICAKGTCEHCDTTRGLRTRPPKPAGRSWG